MHRNVRAVCLVAASLPALLSLVLTTRADEPHPDPRTLRETGRIRPLDEIVSHAKSRFPGKIIEAELHRAGDRYWYEIELLGHDGTVRELRYDAATGAYLDDTREH